MAARKKKVLVVDDEPLVCSYLSSMLSPSYEVLTAYDGTHGLEAVSRERPDLVLLDVDMPLLSGLDVVRRLRADKAGKGLKVIMVTSKGTLEDVETLLSAGADDYVIKPIDLKKLLHKMEQALAKP